MAITKLVALLLTLLCHNCGTAAFAPGLSFRKIFSTSTNSNLEATYQFDTDAKGKASTTGSLWTATGNTNKFNDFVKKLEPGDSLVFPKGKTFWFGGGAVAWNLTGVTFVFDGNVKFVNSFLARRRWPKDSNGNRYACFHFQNCADMHFTSSTPPLVVDKNLTVSSSPFPLNDTRLRMDGNGHGGVIDGGGEKWWGFAKYAFYGENRPKLFRMQACQDVLFENIELKSSPFYNFEAVDVSNLVVRWSRVSCRRPPITDREVRRIEKSFPALKPHDRKTLRESDHNLYQLGALNTDGFDVWGTNVHIHHVDVWNQDDSICVKAPLEGAVSSDFLVEDSRASGMGLVIGALGAKDCMAKNITFRNCYLPETDKGIYFKFLDVPEDQTYAGTIQNIRVENVTMDKPNVPIWIGPAQQADKLEFWEGHPASLLWPWLKDLKGVDCPGTKGLFRDIQLKNVTINNPNAIETRGVGVIRASDDAKYAMKNVVLEDVKVNMTSEEEEFSYYYTGTPNEFLGGSYVDCVATGDTSPVPRYFTDNTN